MNARIVELAQKLPAAPGVYIFLDAAGEALYVGKASDLRARVRSYLKPGGDGRFQLRFLEQQAQDLEFVATATEQEALLLENTVIKKRQPRYNLKLKDDKAFLLLRLDRSEAWPWFTLVRRRRDDGAQYFGPYASAKSVRRTLRLLHKITPLRDCKDSVFHNRARPCIKHQIGRCPAPCTGLIERPAYDVLLDGAVAILRGDAAAALQQLKQRMQAAAQALEFERAQALKLQIEALAAVAEKQFVVAAEGDQDALGVHRAGDDTQVAFLLFRGGVLESCRRFRFKSELPDDLLLSDLLARFYDGDCYVPREVLVPGPVAEAELLQQWLQQKRGGKVELHAPQRGLRRRQLELAQQNAALADAMQVDTAARAAAGAERLAQLLALPEPPRRLHCLDVSTIQGTSTVASRVCFVDGKPDKNAYRRFGISKEHAGDDFAAMAEAVRRSLSLCLQRDDEDLPDLLVVDGGPGQLARAVGSVVELGLQGDFALCGLAKSRLRGVGEARRQTGERVFLPDRELPVALPANAPETLLLAALRDEAHRFAITFHRQRRGRIGSELDDVPGVGKARRRQLLSAFGSLQGLRQATPAQLRAIPGMPSAVADAVYERMHGNDRGGVD